MVDVPTGRRPSRLKTLLGYLDSDPGNLALLSEAAEAALAENEPGAARDLLSRYAEQTPLPARETNVAGLAEMRLGDFAVAAGLFERVLQDAPNDPALRFNLAWCRASLKDNDGAAALLDVATIDALPQAAALHVQLLHDRGDFDSAVDEAKRLLQLYPQHSGLLAAASVLALDTDDPAFARDCAARAGDHPDALATLGTLALADQNNVEAGALFARALKRNANSPRAWLGMGLSKLISAPGSDAARDIQHGAELFGEHVGSWIAAGWAHLTAGDRSAARNCFDKAYALDRNFAESHGSLAVLDILDGRIEEARALTATAQRLDAKSFSGALAKALLLSADGRPEAARAIVERALRTPIDSSGRTIASALAKLALSA